jgi:uncharacterized membrane-anchored protein YhcB (DUF1043 family)
MKKNTGIWIGVGAGMAVGAMMGMMMPMGQRSMKTQVGKHIQKVGVAVDHTMDNLISNLR